MNADERASGQQGYGQQSPQQSSDGATTAQQQPASQQQQQQQQQATMTGQDQEGSPVDTGQAAYGNSGETDTLSQNSSSLGQESDMGQAGGGGALFSGSGEDMGSAQGASAEQGSDRQDFADQGQGALNEDLMGSSDDGGTTDIEIERSQGRESDIKGSSL